MDIDTDLVLIGPKCKLEVPVVLGQDLNCVHGVLLVRILVVLSLLVVFDREVQRALYSVYLAYWHAEIFMHEFWLDLPKLLEVLVRLFVG